MDSTAVITQHAPLGEAAVSSQQPSTVPARRAARRGRKVRALVTAAIGTSVLLVGAGASSATAATTPNYAWVTACFYNASNGSAWTGTTSEQVWNGAAFKTASTLAGTSNGCRAWKVPAGEYVRYFVSQQYRAG